MKKFKQAINKVKTLITRQLNLKGNAAAQGIATASVEVRLENFLSEYRVISAKWGIDIRPTQQVIDLQAQAPVTPPTNG